jgi:hypothetical protein
MDRLCRACFTGEYPIPLPAESLLGKHLLELERPAVVDALDGVATRCRRAATRSRP